MRAAVLVALVQRDLRLVLRSRGVLVPLAVVPLVTLVLIPAVVAFLPAAAGAPEQLVNALPLQLTPADVVQAQVANLSPEESFLTLALLHFMAPVYLLVPLIVASVIAADSFAGERERQSLEALLYLPTSDSELLAAKVLAAWLPAVTVGGVGFVLYGVTINLFGWPVMGRLFFPTWTWLVIGLWVMPAVAGLGLGAGALISSRVGTVQESSQLGSIVVLPLLVLLLAQLGGRLNLGVTQALLLGAFLWAATAVLLRVGQRWCSREALLLRQ
jgi:ABC-2 type transport system permease protein